VDLLWKDEIRPLLLKRFPALTEDQIKEEHAYVYGGAVIQDLGYYPFGGKLFNDLARCVGSGAFDFIVPPATSDELAHVLACAVESVLGLRRMQATGAAV